MQLLVTAVVAFHTGRQLPPGPGRQDGVIGSLPPGFANMTCDVTTPMPSIPHSGSPGPLCYLAGNVASGFVLGPQPVAFKASQSFLFPLALRPSSSWASFLFHLRAFAPGVDPPIMPSWHSSQQHQDVHFCPNRHLTSHMAVCVFVC